jgi:biotin carboxyl carrier protein
MSSMGRKKKLRRLPEGSIHPVRVETLDEGWRVASDEPRIDATVHRASSGVWSVLGADGSSHEALVEREDGEMRVIVGHRVFRFAPVDDAARASSASVSSGRTEVKAPMPGKVVKLLAAEGDRVTAGQGILLFEAMKMQNEIRAPRDGVLAQLSAAEGKIVEARARLFVVESSR